MICAWPEAKTRDRVLWSSLAMNHSCRRLTGLFLIAFTLLGCPTATQPTDTGSNDAADVALADGASDVARMDVVASDTLQADVLAGDSGGCPADLSTAVGMACGTAGQSCGSCSDPCSFCNIIQCRAGQWQRVEVFPMPCDGGADGSRDVITDSAPPPDTTASACGSVTCGSPQVCVHTVMTGGACRPLGDAGMCNPGERRAGDCCVSFSEEFRCEPRPSGCGAMLTCGCAMSLCGSAPGSCPCQSASTTSVECACLRP